jgi:GT2 family glycosyltransferase
VAAKRGHGERCNSANLKAGEVFGASGSSAFYRRSAFLEVGGFAESFRSYFEDVDLSFRLKRAGHSIWFEPSSRVYHHVSSSHGRPNRSLLEQQSRNEERVFWRNIPARSMKQALMPHLAVLLGKACRRWQEGAFLPFLCGRLRALAEWRQLMQARRRLQTDFPSALAEDWGVEPTYWGRRTAFQ